MAFLQFILSHLSVLGLTVGALTTCMLATFIAKSFLRLLEERALLRCLARKQACCLSSKERMAKNLETDDEMVKSRRGEIFNKSFSELQQDIRHDQYSAVEVLHAYQLKALEADKETNCVTEFIEEAEQWAKFLDQLSFKKPLHGIPISVKDNFNVKGYDSTLGLVNNLNKPAEADSLLISTLRDLGAVPFVKTNVPQTLLSFGCNNPVFGITTNPYDKNRIPGGSSGGEGALIAKGGSLLGLGSDIGGSGRIPAHMCGVCAIKPTSKRLSGKNVVKSLEGVVGVYVAPSLLAKDVDTITTCFHHLLMSSMFKNDPYVVPLPFQENILSQTTPLRIGYYENDGFFAPTPGCARAVKKVKNLLQLKGHTLIKFQVPDPWKAYELSMGLMLADGNKTLQRKWKKDIVDPHMKQNKFLSSLPVFCRKGIAKFLQHNFLFRSPRLAVLANETGRSAPELWQLLADREQYCNKFINKWLHLQLDAMIAPGFPFPAPPLDAVKRLLPGAFCTMLYNLLDFPVGVVPVTHETENDQFLLQNYSIEGDVVFKIAKQATQNATGLPIAVQIISTPWKEEMVLRVMAEVEKIQQVR